MNKLGRDCYIRNGVGYGFISSPELYNNGWLELGFGRLSSGYGDWGGGFDRASTTPLKIVIDKYFIIKSVETDSFSNNRGSKIVKYSEEIKNRIKIGDKLNIEDVNILKSVKTIFDFLPCKSNIGHDVFRHPHMLEYYTEPIKKNHYNNIDDPKNINFQLNGE